MSADFAADGLARTDVADTRPSREARTQGKAKAAVVMEVKLIVEAVCTPAILLSNATFNRGL